jgi:phage-related minor tail protein
LNYNAERQRIIKQMADAVELSEARIATFEEEQKRKTELENSYAEGAKRALQDMAEQMKPLTVAQDAVKRGFDALGDAIDDFVETGKFSFKQFAASVIADIAKIVAKALVLQAIKTIFGGFGIPGLAEGGPAKAGKPYIVGEKGPELFVPKTSGTVVPNNAMKNGVATGAVNAPVTNNYNTYNINAVDAKSVAQLFAENRKVLLGTVKMAERELPYMA